jgi:hypothetical protein
MKADFMEIRDQSPASPAAARIAAVLRLFGCHRPRVQKKILALENQDKIRVHPR